MKSVNYCRSTRFLPVQRPGAPRGPSFTEVKVRIMVRVRDRVRRGLGFGTRLVMGQLGSRGGPGR